MKITIHSVDEEGNESWMTITGTSKVGPEHEPGSVEVSLEFDPPIDDSDPRAHVDPLEVQLAVLLHFQKGETA